MNSLSKTTFEACSVSSAPANNSTSVHPGVFPDNRLKTLVKIALDNIRRVEHDISTRNVAIRVRTVNSGVSKGNKKIQLEQEQKKEVNLFPAVPMQTSDIKDINDYLNLKKYIKIILNEKTLGFEIDEQSSLRFVLLKLLCHLKFDETKCHELLTKLNSSKDKIHLRELCDNLGFNIKNIEEKLTPILNDQIKTKLISKIIYVLLSNYPNYLDKKIESIFILGALNTEDSEHDAHACIAEFFGKRNFFNFPELDMSIGEALDTHFLIWLTQQTLLAPQSVFYLISAFMFPTYHEWEEIEPLIEIKMENDDEYAKEIAQLEKEISQDQITAHADLASFHLKEKKLKFLKETCAKSNQLKNEIFKDELKSYFLIRNAIFNSKLGSVSLSTLELFQHPSPNPDFPLSTDLTARVYSIWNESFAYFIEQLQTIKKDLEDGLDTAYSQMLQNYQSSIRKNRLSEQAIKKDFDARHTTTREVISKITSFCHLAELRKARLLDGLLQMNKFPPMRHVFKIKIIENLEKMLQMIAPLKNTIKAHMDDFYVDARSDILQQVNLLKNIGEKYQELHHLIDTLNILCPHLLGLLEIEEDESTSPNQPSAIQDDVVLAHERKKRLRYRKALETIDVYESNIETEQESVPENDPIETKEDHPQDALPSKTQPSIGSVDLLLERKTALIHEIKDIKNKPLKGLTPYLLTERGIIEFDVFKQVEAIPDPKLRAQAKISLKESHDHIVLAAQGFELFINTLNIKDFRLARVALRTFLLDCCIALEQSLQTKRCQAGIDEKSEHHSLVKHWTELKLPDDDMIKILDQGHLYLRYTQDYRPVKANETLALPLQWLDHFDLLASKTDDSSNVNALKLMLPQIFKCFSRTCMIVGYSPEILSPLENIQAATLAALDEKCAIVHPSATPSKEIVKLKTFLSTHGEALKLKYAPFNPTVPLREALDYLEFIDAGRHLKKAYPDESLKFFHMRLAAEGEKVIRALLKTSVFCYGCGTIAGHHYNNYLHPLRQEANFVPFSREQIQQLERAYLGIGHHYLHLNANVSYALAKEASFQKALEFQSQKTRTKKTHKSKDFNSELAAINSLVDLIVDKRLEEFCNL